MTKLSDLTNLPTSKDRDYVWLGLILPDKIASLKRLHEAIAKWRTMTDAEFEEFKKQCAQKHKPSWDEFGYDPVEDEAFMLHETERVMFANLAVTIASAAENFIIDICKKRNVNCANDNGETHFGIACQCLGCSLKVVICELPGYSGNQRARMLGNCFKHAEGKTNERFVRKYGGDLGKRIEYENEDWESAISETETLLSGIVQRLKPEQKP